MMTQTIGEYLKEKRLEKHIQLEQIAQTTHIRLKYLEALEKDRLNAFPSRVHGRGFLRMYADYLGVPAQPLLDAWDSGIIQQEPDHPSQPEEIKEEQVESIQQEISLTIGKDEYAPPGIEAEEQTPGIEEVPSSSEASEIFKEIGQTIREQRESLGLTLNDVERFTHRGRKPQGAAFSGSGARYD
jgi:cytoskeleton protein RodZ